MTSCLDYTNGLLTGASRIDGLAVDVTSQLIYYTDVGLNSVGVINYDGSVDKTLLTYIDNSLIVAPRGIVLDTTRGCVVVFTYIYENSHFNKYMMINIVRFRKDNAKL